MKTDLEAGSRTHKNVPQKRKMVKAITAGMKKNDANSQHASASSFNYYHNLMTLVLFSPLINEQTKGEWLSYLSNITHLVSDRVRMKAQAAWLLCSVEH